MSDIAVERGRRNAARAVRWLLPALLVAILAVTTLLPIGALLIRSLFDRAGGFAGAANFIRYATEPGLSIAAWNSIELSAVSTVLVLLLAFPFAYGLTRSRMPMKTALRVAILVPLLAPSLLPAFGLVYLFGKQGVLTSWLLGQPLYGPVGIVLASIFYALPHAVLILSAGLAGGDARLYEAARALKAGPWRTFAAVTLPSCRYSIISAACVVYIMVFTDFGIPSVVGGSTNVLATDIYKLVIGRFDFELGAVVGVLLLLPAIVAYGIDVAARRTQRASLSGKSVPIEPERSLPRDLALLVFCGLVAVGIIGIVATAIYGSLVKFWPYNLTLGLHNYDAMLSDDENARSLGNSLVMAGSTAAVGVVLIAVSAWLVARSVGPALLTQALQGLALLPVAVPGLVLGLGYIFFFNNPANPLHALQGSLVLIVLCTIAHLYTVPHLMAVGALVKLDREIDLAAQALRSGPINTARRVFLPALAPTLVDVAGYLFLNAMTTVSALVFLYTAQTKVAAITIVNLAENGRVGQAAAMAVLVMLVSTVAALVQLAVKAFILERQTWRRRTS